MRVGIRGRTILVAALCLLVEACVGADGVGGRDSRPWSERVGGLAERAVLRVHSESGNVGSAFFVHPSGLAITNEHVVAGSRGGFADTLFGPAGFEVLSTAPSRDLALLRVAVPGPAPSLRLGSSTEMALGAPVLTAGAPQGMFPMVTTGVFNGRSVPGSIAALLVPEMLIHSAPTLRGSSGCPVLDADGLVVGVQAAKPNQELVRLRAADDEEGELFDRDLARWGFQTEAYGFAVPVEDLHRILPSMIAPEWNSGLETGFQFEQGGGAVRVVSVLEGSPAELAGLAVGDEVLSLRGAEVLTTVDLALGLCDPSPVELVVSRGGAQRSLMLRRAEHEAPAWGELAPGVRWFGYHGQFIRAPSLAALAPFDEGVMSHITIPSQLSGREGFGLELRAWLDVPSAGSWTFELGSDDGALLYLRDRLVVDNDGLHAHKHTKASVDLEAGPLPLRVVFFEAGGEESLRLRWGMGEDPLVEVAPELLRFPAPSDG